MGVGCGLEIPAHPTRGVLWIRLKTEYKSSKEQSCAELRAVGPGMEIRPGAWLNAALEGARGDFGVLGTLRAGCGRVSSLGVSSLRVRVSERSRSGGARKRSRAKRTNSTRVGDGAAVLRAPGGWNGNSDPERSGASCRNGVLGQRNPPLIIARRPSRVISL